MTSKPKQMAMFSMEVENLFSADKRVWQSLSDEDREKFIDDVFDYYRESGFPYASYTDDELLDDFYDLQHLATSRRDSAAYSGTETRKRDDATFVGSQMPPKTRLSDGHV